MSDSKDDKTAVPRINCDVKKDVQRKDLSMNICLTNHTTDKIPHHRLSGKMRGVVNLLTS